VGFYLAVVGGAASVETLQLEEMEAVLLGASDAGVPLEVSVT
jgi:hypothetical protein